MSLLSDVVGFDPVEIFNKRKELVEDVLVRPVFEYFNPGQLAVVDEYYGRLYGDPDREDVTLGGDDDEEENDE